jgi:hypothetical protein
VFLIPFFLLASEVEPLDSDGILMGGCSCLHGNERIYPFLHFMPVDGFSFLIDLKMHVAYFLFSLLSFQFAPDYRRVFSQSGSEPHLIYVCIQGKFKKQSPRHLCHSVQHMPHWPPLLVLSSSPPSALSQNGHAQRTNLNWFLQDSVPCVVCFQSAYFQAIQKNNKI